MGRFDIFDARYDMPSDDEIVEVDVLLSATTDDSPSAFHSMGMDLDQAAPIATTPLQDDVVVTEDARTTNDEIPISLEVTKPPAKLPRLPAVKVTVYEPCEQNLPCPVCLEEDIPQAELMNVPGCRHSICKPCLQNYLVFIATSSIMFPVPCPRGTCGTFLDTQFCLRVLRELPEARPHDLLERRSIERTFVTHMAHCAHNQCRTPLSIDMSACPKEKLEDYKACFKCPLCRRKTCVNCQTGWHRNRTCAQHRNEDGAGELWFLARSRKWTTCPACQTFVERTDGCDHISCLCGAEFCYDCGGSWLRCRCYGDEPTRREVYYNDPRWPLHEIAEREERRTEWFARAENGEDPEADDYDEVQWKREFDEARYEGELYEKRQAIRLVARARAEERAEIRDDRSRRARKRAAAKEKRRCRDAKSTLFA